MRRLLSACTVILASALCGCYISDKPLVAGSEAEFPFETISFREAGDGEIMRMTHEGDAYVMRKQGEDGQLTLRFKSLGGDLYLAQMLGEEDGEKQILYAVVDIDWDKKTAETYEAMARMDMERPGLRTCADQALCIDDLDVYVALAKESVATGEPLGTYEIVEAK